MKKVLLIVLVLLIMGISGCSYVFPSAVNVEPAETTISEEKRVINPPATQNRRKIVIRINKKDKENME